MSLLQPHENRKTLWVWACQHRQSLMGAAASGYFWPPTVVGDHYFSLSLVILLLEKFPSNNLI